MRAKRARRAEGAERPERVLAAGGLGGAVSPPAGSGRSSGKFLIFVNYSLQDGCFNAYLHAFSRKHVKIFDQGFRTAENGQLENEPYTCIERGQK